MKIWILSLGLLLYSVAGFSNGIKMTTYNVALAPGFVPLSEERVSVVIDLLQQQESDYFCLAEVWRKKDRKKILKALEEDYPHVHMTDIDQLRRGPRPTCRISDLFGEGKFVSCILDKCKDQDDSDFTQCLTQKCDVPLDGLIGERPYCAQSLMAQVGSSTTRAIIRVLNPLWRAGIFAYKGSNGLMVLSKKPFAKKGLVDLTNISTLNRRGALYTKIIDENKEPHHLYCAHLSANLERTAPYTGNFEGWEQENMAQVQKLLESADHGPRATYVMGDMNCSFALPSLGIRPDFEASCELFRQAGFDNFFLEQNPECTFCEENTLLKNDLKDGRPNFMLDHIFTKHVPQSKTSRVFDELVEVEVDGKTILSHPSDHYGVVLERD